MGWRGTIENGGCQQLNFFSTATNRKCPCSDQIGWVPSKIQHHRERIRFIKCWNHLGMYQFLKSPQGFHHLCSLCCEHFFPKAKVISNKNGKRKNSLLFPHTWSAINQISDVISRHNSLNGQNSSTANKKHLLNGFSS